MTDRLHKCWLVAAAGLFLVAVSACTSGDGGVRGDLPIAASTDGGDTGTGDGTEGGGEPVQGGNSGPLGGRAKYEGDAAGKYTSGELNAAFRYFSAAVTLIADFRDESIQGVVTDGRDTVTDEQIFRHLRLEPAAMPADDTDSFRDGVVGVVNGNIFTGNWSGRFAGEGTSSTGLRSSVDGTFQAARIDELRESLTGTFSGDYRGYTNRTVTALNDLSVTMKSRLAYSIGRAAQTDGVYTGDAAGTGGSDTGATVWNTGVSQSSENSNSEEAAVANWAVNARYEGDDLVFDRINLLAASPTTLTTSGEPEAPDYRGAISSIWPGWKGVEHLQVDSSKFWNYSILVADIDDNDDTGYLAGGIWASLPDLDNPADVRRPLFAAAAGGNDPFEGGNIAPLKGRAGYQGRAIGLYASTSASPAFRYFGADVRLTADFSHNRIDGVVMDGKDTATDELLFAELALRDADLPTEGTASFGSFVAGVLNGWRVYGDWAGQFLGNGASPTDLPGSIAGTFGAQSYDAGGNLRESLVGIFGAYEDLTRQLSGHEFAAGDITVEPGDSDEHGNVVMSCPADGPACAVTVRADGTAFYDRNGGVPTFVFTLPDAPVVELDGAVHVGAGVAPPAGQLAAGGTRNGVAVSTGRVQDGVGSEDLLAYLREHVSKTRPGLETFAVRPVVRVAEGTGAEFVEYTKRAVQLINTALPYEQRILFSRNPAPALSVYQDVPDGQIFVDFTPWEDWNDPARVRGGTWRNSRRTHRYDDEAQQWEVLERRASHIWIDSESRLGAWALNADTGRWERTVLESRVEDTDTVVKSSSDDAVVRTVASTLLQGLGLVTAVDATSFPDSLLNFTDVRQRTVELSTGGTFRFNERVYVPGHILYPLDREALLAAYGRLPPGTLPDDLSAGEPWNVG